MPKLETNPSAALTPECLAPTGGDEKGQAQFGARPDILTGLLERAALLEEHCSLMSTVLKKISVTARFLALSFSFVFPRFLPEFSFSVALWSGN